MGNQHSHNQEICDSGSEIHRSNPERPVPTIRQSFVESSSRNQSGVNFVRCLSKPSCCGSTSAAMFTTSRPVGAAISSGRNIDVQRPPLRFNRIHGDNVALTSERRIASRTESFCKALAFSDRSIVIDEVVCIRFSEVKTSWSGVLRFGVTNMDPASYGANLPKYACPDMTSKEGTWAKAMSDRYCQEGNIMSFFVRENGEMYYGINGSMKGLFLSGVNTQAPMFVVVDIYGNTTSVEFVDDCNVPQLNSQREPQRSLPPPPTIPLPSPPSDSPLTPSAEASTSVSVSASNEIANDAPSQTTATVQRGQEEQLVDRNNGPSTAANAVPAADRNSAPGPSSISNVSSTVQQSEPTSSNSVAQLTRELETRLTFRERQERSMGQAPRNFPTNSAASTSSRHEFVSLVHNTGIAIGPLQFHTTHGRTVSLNSDRTIATRTATEYCCGYVFTNRPVKFLEKVVIQVLNVELAYEGGMAFGVTNCDPSQLTNFVFPDDADDLLNRPEFWAVMKDYEREPVAGDELCFYLNETGEVIYQKNNGRQITLMHVDPTLTYYMFFDVYGRAQSVRCAGTTNARLRPPSPAQPSVPLHQLPHRRRQQHVQHNARAVLNAQRAAVVSSGPATSTPAAILQQFQAMQPQRTSAAASNLPPPPPPMIAPRRGGEQNRPGPQNSNFPVGQPFPNNGRTGFGPAPPRPNRPPPPAPPQRAQPVPNTQRPCSGPVFASTGNAPPSLPSSASASSLPANVGGTHMSSPPAAQAGRAGECSVCMDKPVNSAVYPCGHMCMCYECGRQTWNRQGVCPICRQNIKDIIRVFPSG